MNQYSPGTRPRKDKIYGRPKDRVKPIKVFLDSTGKPHLFRHEALAASCEAERVDRAVALAAGPITEEDLFALGPSVIRKASLQQGEQIEKLEAEINRLNYMLRETQNENAELVAEIESMSRSYGNSESQFLNRIALLELEIKHLQEKRGRMLILDE